MAFVFGMQIDSRRGIENVTVTKDAQFIYDQYEALREKLHNVTNEGLWDDLDDEKWQGAVNALCEEFFEAQKEVNALKFLDVLRKRGEVDTADYAEKFVTSFPGFYLRGNPVVNLNQEAEKNKRDAVERFSNAYTNHLIQQGELLRTGFEAADMNILDAVIPKDILDAANRQRDLEASNN